MDAGWIGFLIIGLIVGIAIVYTVFLESSSNFDHYND